MALNLHRISVICQGQQRVFNNSKMSEKSLRIWQKVAVSQKRIQNPVKHLR